MGRRANLLVKREIEYGGSYFNNEPDGIYTLLTNAGIQIWANNEDFPEYADQWEIDLSADLDEDADHPVLEEGTARDGMLALIARLKETPQEELNKTFERQSTFGTTVTNGEIVETLEDWMKHAINDSIWIEWF